MSNAYLVTGGAGFIGSHLVEDLLAEGCHVKVYDNFSSGFESNLAGLQSAHGKLEIIRGDIRDAHSLAAAMQGVTGVFHLAALVSVPQSIEQPDLSFDINGRGTQLVLNEARKNGVKRVVMASSAAVYGDNENLPLSEDEVSSPLSPYGLEKSLGEQMGRLYVDLYQINVTCLRFFNVFGPRQPPDSHYSGVVSIFAKKAAAREVPVFYGDGLQTRDFVFVKDVANALKLSMQSDMPGFHVYNVGSGKEITVKALWDAYGSVSGFLEEAKQLPARDGDIKTSLSDISKIKADLGFHPSGDFKGNLQATYSWLKSQLNS
ncbi:MAG: SDR family NAD(P)-dependent oxidoreductase [Gallionella sp.]|nr:SDR family NAD(P)-dependent oxidoreductase [Gallionella sp.]